MWRKRALEIISFNNVPFIFNNCLTDAGYKQLIIDLILSINFLLKTWTSPLVFS
jgi:hypothetical protein